MSTEVDRVAAFPAGVASFDPEVDRVILWTACTVAGRCSWEIASDADFVHLVDSGALDVGAESPAVSVDVGELRAGHTYWYRFASGGVTSPTGRTRTLPDRHPGRLRVGVTCCARFGQATFAVYRELAETDVDVVVHLGDYVYEDTKADIEGRESEPSHDCVTLDDYRRRHLQSRCDPDLQRLHQQHPMIVIWDDHDIADNACRTGAQNHDEAEQGPWADRLTAAVTAHHEFLPKRLAEGDDPTTAWRELRAGSLVSFVCTETRAHRDAQAGLPGTPPASDPRRSMLGSAQRSWLSSAVADRTPTWMIVLSGTVVSEFEIDAPDELSGALPEKYVIQDGRAINSDQWDGYRADRDALVTAAGRRGGNTVVLSGDIHSSWVVEGPADGGSAVAVEFTCPPAATTPLGQLLPPGGSAVLARTVQQRLRHVRWMSGDHRGFMVAEITPAQVHVSYWWVDETPDASVVQLGRRWVVPSGALPVRVTALDEDRERSGSAPSVRRSTSLVAVISVASTLAIAVAVAVAGGIAAMRWRARGSRTTTGHPGRWRSTCPKE